MTEVVKLFLQAGQQLESTNVSVSNDKVDHYHRHHRQYRLLTADKRSLS